MKVLKCLLLTIALATTTCWAQSPEVKGAYRAIPHRYTPFQPSKATMGAADKAYLKANFQVVNQAVVARVQAMQRKDYAGYELEARGLLKRLEAQSPPKNLVQYHRLVIGAIEDQRSYFRAWKKKPSAPFNARDPKVRSASSKLQQAYGLLLRQYPSEAKQVKQAFFDHLCALDFI